MASQNSDLRGAALGSERVRAALGSDGEFALREAQYGEFALCTAIAARLSFMENLSLGCVGSPKSFFSMALGPLTGAGVGVRVL